jgi:hypothetical protein
MVMELVPDEFTDDDRNRVRRLEAAFPGVTLADLLRSPTQSRDHTTRYMHAVSGDTYIYHGRDKTWTRTYVGLPVAAERVM